MTETLAGRDSGTNQIGTVAHFCIVTPVFNGADYIDETIASVLTQAGDFEIDYHIQDGRSTDDTMQRIGRWAELLHSGRWPVLCRAIRFTYASKPDSGMYDAINQAFDRALMPGPDTVMGWVNADDRIAPGAFSTILNIRRTFPEIRFLSGRVSMLDASGSIIGVNLPRTYSQPCMAAGLYDGRALPFVMQEGTFWCSDLWRKVGSAVDTRFRLAGDWDLWRRMAVHAPFVTIDSVLGFHRRRPGQLSSAMDVYYGEVDRLLAMGTGQSAPEAAPLRSKYDAVFKEFEQLQADPVKFRNSPYSAIVVRFDLNRKAWEKIDNFGLILGAPALLSTGGQRRSLTIVPISGFHSPEGPYPEWSMPSGIRWMRDPNATGEVFLPRAGTYEMVLRCRSWSNRQSVALTANGTVIAQVRITPHGNDREIEIRAQGTFGSGLQVLGIEVKQPPDVGRLLLVNTWHIEPLQRRNPREITPVAEWLPPIAALAGPLTTCVDWPRVSIVVPTRNQSAFITDTLESVLRQGYPNLELIVVDGGSTDDTPEILRRYSRYITHVISEPDSGQSNAINKGFAAATGEIMTWLNSDDLLAKGAIHSVAFAFRTSGADLVAGVCDVFDATNQTTHRHLPCLTDGSVLPLNRLLDLRNCWLLGQFFHQPEVFFTRAMWLKAGGHVDESLYYSMDYDLWVRMALEGARVSVIGHTVAHYRMHAKQKTSSPEAYMPELIAHAEALRAGMGAGALPAAKSPRQRIRIVFFNDYGFKYGAGLAHRRMAEALALAGQDVLALAYADFDVGAADPRLSPEAVADAILAEKPDLIFLGNLHAIRADFNLIGALLSRNVPTVFYAHDQWLVSGRCGYPGSCLRYLSQCNDECPTAHLFPALAPDEVAPAFIAKRAELARATATSRFAVFTNSHFMRDHLLESLPAAERPPIRAVPFGIDTSTFTNGERWQARVLLGLPGDRFIIVASATDITDERKGTRLLIEALRSLPDPHRLLLLVMGFGTWLPDLPCEVRFTGYLSREELVALHYRAADIFVGPSLQEAFGQSFIEAAACGVPAVAFKVGGVMDAVAHGISGLLIEEPTVEALASGIQRLRTDVGLRRQLAAQAVLFVRNRFSLEASAARLLAALVAEQVLALNLAPNVVLATGAPPRVPMRYLTGPGAGEVRDLDPSDWLPLQNVSTETSLDTSGGLPLRFWWACGPACSLALRVATAGEYLVHMRVRCHLPEQTVWIRANGGARHEVPIPLHRFEFVQDIETNLSLIAGPNRLDIAFAAMVKEDRGPRQLALLIEEIEAIPSSLALEGAPHDGALEFMDGFSYLEGPYPEYDLPNRFHWALGTRCRLQLFSALAERRVVDLRIRNIHPGQTLTIYLRNKPVLTRTLGDAAMTSPVSLRFEATFNVGHCPVHIEATHCSEPDDGGRKLAFLFEDLVFRSLDELDPLPERDAVRWDLSDGFGGEEGPFPQFGLLTVFRWVIDRQPRLIIDRVSAGPAQLFIRYRAPTNAQWAWLTLNDTQTVRVDFPAVSFTDGRKAEVPMVFRTGPNVLAFEFAESAPPSNDPRELVLLLEAVNVGEPVSPPAGCTPSTAEAVGNRQDSEA